MPAKSQWLLRIPDIVESLSALNVPVVDRAICEQLFRVRRRRAIELIQQFGGYRTGNAVLVDRLELIRHLEDLGTDSEVAREFRRKEKLSATLDEVARRSAAARIIIKAATPPTASQAFPTGVNFSPGRLTIEFVGVQELLTRLYGLAQSAAANFERFSSLAERG
jgi:hypothetical protein